MEGRVNEDSGAQISSPAPLPDAGGSSSGCLSEPVASESAGLSLPPAAANSNPSSFASYN
jgi:hypothetical protein